MTDDQRKKFEALMRPLTPEEYAAAPVPTREQLREAMRKGARDLREAWLFKPRGRW